MIYLRFDISHLIFATGPNGFTRMKQGTATATIVDSRSQADILEVRLIDFAVRIIKLSAKLPKTAAARHISGQILRSGTSPAPNCGEARGAESPNDFIHKLRGSEGTERNLNLVAHD